MDLTRSFPIVAHAKLANAITATSVLLGMAGVAFAGGGHVLGAATCCALALPCDVLHGVVARRRGEASAFGAQLDTLADAVSFCLLPAALGLALPLPAWARLPQLLYGLSGVLRLARFGEVGMRQVGGVECFEGVPTTLAAAVVLVAVAAGAWAGPGLQAPLLIATYVALALAMVSALPVPKRGPHVWLMWALVPASIVALWARGQ
jgi:CDP-diacylglycerol--serine O-phosphatidyltransferase